ncbi:chromate transporter [Rhizobium sp. BE258]|nr:chromate efflux transporter [Rhizobium sp. BE258]MDR7144986.1 chromate transporter [Rhizobium sp. BE258]
MAEKQLSRYSGTAREVFAAFIKLGLSAFGGPIAHLGYFRDEFVTRRDWLDERSYANLVALCQFLPGPTSSQVGFALGLARGGPLGALLAWVAFTLPSAILIYLFAYSAPQFSGAIGGGVIVGLKIAAVGIVAHAVWGMARNLCPDRPRATIALGSVLIVVFGPSSFGQVLAIVFGAGSGYLRCQDRQQAHDSHLQFQISRTSGGAILVLFFVMLAGLPLLASALGSQGFTVFSSFFRSGSLVFGGGHVVLPLLETEVVRSGWATQDQVLAGYGAAQAVPGPLFTFAAYLGAVIEPETNKLTSATIALMAIFLPGFMVLLGVLPFWDDLRRYEGVRAAMTGANAAVVGILGAAFYDPVFTTAILGPHHFALALSCFVLLAVWKAAPG